MQMGTTSIGQLLGNSNLELPYFMAYESSKKFGSKFVLISQTKNNK